MKSLSFRPHSFAIVFSIALIIWYQFNQEFQVMSEISASPPSSSSIDQQRRNTTTTSPSVEAVTTNDTAAVAKDSSRGDSDNLVSDTSLPVSSIPTRNVQQPSPSSWNSSMESTNKNYPLHTSNNASSAPKTTTTTATTKGRKVTKFTYQDPKMTNESRILMYVHVGKTGGYSMDAVLYSNCAWYGLKEPKQECFRNFRNYTLGPTSMGSHLSFFTRSTLHLAPRQAYHKWIDKTTTFLVSVRNPIDRVVSAFDMDHVGNNNNIDNLNSQPQLTRKRRKFYRCFPTAEHLAQAIVDDDINNNNRTDLEERQCSGKWARDALMGRLHNSGNVVTHLKYNYQYYANLTFGKYPDREIMVVRTKHLWHDLGRLDQSPMMMNGTGNLTKMMGHHFDHGSSHYEVQSKLSKEGRRIFCDALREEIAIYRSLVERAVNLEEWEKSETLNQLRDDCAVGDATAT